jgi:peptide/nickel transport system substrate-binding protein
LYRVNRRQVLQGGLGLVAGSAAFVLACGGGKKQESPPAGAAAGTAPAGAAAPTPKRGGRLLDMVTISPTNNFNPVTNWADGIYLSGGHVYDRLINTRLGKDTAKEYVLEAAQSVELPEPTTVIFKLKPGMRFQNRAPVNGRPVSAEDVVKSQLYVRDNPAAQDRSFQVSSMQSVEAPDAQTVVFKLKAPNAYLFSATQLAYPQSNCIIPRELLDNLDRAWPVGSGPYELVEADLGVRYLYRRFEGYREAAKGLPYIDEREIRIVTDAAAQEAAFRSEQSYIWFNIPVPRLADQVKRDLGDRIVMDEYLTLSMVPLSMNATRPPFKDQRVREAVYRFIDRKQFLDLLDEGRGAVPPGLLQVGMTEYQLDPKQTEKYWRQDLRASRQLLEAAGFDFNRELTMIAINRPRDNQGMEIFQQQASKVGMKVRPRSVPFAEWHNMIHTGDWDVYWGYSPAYDTPQKVLRFQHTDTQSVYVHSGLKDPEIDRMIEKSEQTLDRNERVKLVKDIQIALLEKYTPFFLTHNFTAYIARWKYVRDYEVARATHAMYRTEMWLDK